MPISRTKGVYSWRPRAVFYGLGVAGLATLASLAILLIVVRPVSALPPDSFVRNILEAVHTLWRLFVLPLTLGLGFLSMPGYDIMQRHRHPLLRILSFAINVVLVVAVGYLVSVVVALTLFLLGA
jgi:hypothetical protein